MTKEEASALLKKQLVDMTEDEKRKLKQALNILLNSIWGN